MVILILTYEICRIMLQRLYAYIKVAHEKL